MFPWGSFLLNNLERKICLVLPPEIKTPGDMSGGATVAAKSWNTKERKLFLLARQLVSDTPPNHPVAREPTAFWLPLSAEELACKGDEWDEVGLVRDFSITGDHPIRQGCTVGDATRLKNAESLDKLAQAKSGRGKGRREEDTHKEVDMEELGGIQTRRAANPVQTSSLRASSSCSASSRSASSHLVSSRLVSSQSTSSLAGSLHAGSSQASSSARPQAAHSHHHTVASSSQLVGGVSSDGLFSTSHSTPSMVDFGCMEIPPELDLGQLGITPGHPLQSVFNNYITQGGTRHSPDSFNAFSNSYNNYPHNINHGTTTNPNNSQLYHFNANSRTNGYDYTGSGEMLNSSAFVGLGQMDFEQVYNPKDPFGLGAK